MTNISALAAGACAGKQELFFATGKIATEKALGICERCPVMRQCEEYALSIQMHAGIWAGRTPKGLRLLKTMKGIILWHL